MKLNNCLHYYWSLYCLLFFFQHRVRVWQVQVCCAGNHRRATRTRSQVSDGLIQMMIVKRCIKPLIWQDVVKVFMGCWYRQLCRRCFHECKYLYSFRTFVWFLEWLCVSVCLFQNICCYFHRKACSVRWPCLEAISTKQPGVRMWRRMAVAEVKRATEILWRLTIILSCTFWLLVTVCSP